MSLFKRGKYWVADFWFNKQRHQVSTRCTNHEKAKIFLAAYRTNLALTGVGVVQKEPVPLLSTFLETTFLDHVRQQHAGKPNTLRFYTERVKCLLSYLPFKQMRLDEIGELAVQGYKDFRLGKKLAISSINAELRVLRKALIFADRCQLIRYQKVRSLPGEKHREFVLSGELEKLYLSIAPYPLKEAAILMLDLGLRPSECVSLRKDSVSPDRISVLSGKTANARRSLPQTERTRKVFELCFALFPDSPWVFPGLKGKHYSRISLGNLHRRVCGAKLPREFVLHGLRHTCLTRWAESGMKPFTLQKLAGHHSITVTQRYIHVGTDHIAVEMRQAEIYAKTLRGEIHDPSLSIENHSAAKTKK